MSHPTQDDFLKLRPMRQRDDGSVSKVQWPEPRTFAWISSKGRPDASANVLFAGGSQQVNLIGRYREQPGSGMAKRKPVMINIANLSAPSADALPDCGKSTVPVGTAPRLPARLATLTGDGVLPTWHGTLRFSRLTTISRSCRPQLRTPWCSYDFRDLYQLEDEAQLPLEGRNSPPAPADSCHNQPARPRSKPTR